MNANEYTKGWLVGNFEPSLINSKDIEVGLKYYKKGDKESSHVHKIITEYTIVVSGKIKMNDEVYIEKDIVTILPNVPTNFESLEDSITLVIKTPSIPSDKHIC